MFIFLIMSVHHLLISFKNLIYIKLTKSSNIKYQLHCILFVQTEVCVTERDKLILNFVWCRVEIIVILRLIRIQRLVYPLTLSFIPNMMLLKRFPHIHITLNNSLGNTIIPSQRLVTTSASLRTQTGLCHLILQVLNIKSLLPNGSVTSVCNNLEHGLVTLTESFSPLRSVLHNLPS